VKTLSEIKTILHSHAADIHSRYGITRLEIFGSVVRGEAHEKSDVDMLAEFDRPISLLDLVGAENHLIDLLGMEVDLIPRRSVRPELKERIFKEAVPV